MMQLFPYGPEAIPRTTKARSLLRVALTLGQVGVMGFVLSSMTNGVTRPQVTLLTGLQLNMSLSESLGRPNTVQGM